MNDLNTLRDLINTVKTLESYKGQPLSVSQAREKVKSVLNQLADHLKLLSDCKNRFGCEMRAEATLRKIENVAIHRDYSSSTPTLETAISWLTGHLSETEYREIPPFVQELERWAEKTAAEKPQVGAGEIPDDTITLAIAVKDYMVSRSTLKRKIENGDLKTYRPANAPKNGGHRVSRKEIETFFEPKR